MTDERQRMERSRDGGRANVLAGDFLARTWHGPHLAEPGRSESCNPRPNAEAMVPSEPCRVLLVSSSDERRAWLRLASTTDCDRYRFEAVAAASAEDMLSLLEDCRHGMVLIDARLAEKLGTHVLRGLRRFDPEIAWLVTGKDVSVRWLRVLIHLRAKGFIRWSDADDQVERALDAVRNGELWFPRKVLQWIYQSLIVLVPPDLEPFGRNASSGPDLTLRETEMLALMGQGLSNKQIASRLDISISTVKKHIAQVFTKRGLHSRRQTLG